MRPASRGSGGRKRKRPTSEPPALASLPQRALSLRAAGRTFLKALLRPLATAHGRPTSPRPLPFLRAPGTPSGTSSQAPAPLRLPVLPWPPGFHSHRLIFLSSLSLASQRILQWRSPSPTILPRLVMSPPRTHATWLSRALSLIGTTLLLPPRPGPRLLRRPSRGSFLNSLRHPLARRQLAWIPIHLLSQASPSGSELLYPRPPLLLVTAPSPY